MTPYRFRLQPCSAFGTRPLGDTLFGQLCWAVRNRYGEVRLNELLEGYTRQHPFCVVSDALPAGYLPRPNLPARCYPSQPGLDRKAFKKRVWLAWDQFATPVSSWPEHCKTAADIPGSVPKMHAQPHNTLNRETGTTGTDEFAPYSMEQLWYDTPGALEVIVLLDETRLPLAEFATVLNDIGLVGFGRDASIGLGKFILENPAPEPFTLPVQEDTNAWLTLAPCAPQGCGFDTGQSYYQTFTRFGRHGDVAVHLPGGPFKAPVLLAQTAAVFTPQAYTPRLFVGQGLGGDGRLSRTLPATVQQGYAPVVGIRLPAGEETL